MVTGDKAEGTPVSACQVDAKAPDFGGEEEDVHGLIVVEVVDKARAQGHRRGAIHPVILEACSLNSPLQDVQHLLRLGKHQGPVSLTLPGLQNLQQLLGSFMILGKQGLPGKGKQG